MNKIDLTALYAVDRIIGIDPGKNGGIVVDSPNEMMKANKMPEEIKEFYDFLIYQKSLGDKILIGIEQVQTMPSDSAEENAGMQYRIEKMLKNYHALLTACEIAGVAFVTIPPQSWQNGLNLGRKGMKKTDRKNLYKRRAKRIAPHMEITLWNADAVCIARFLKQKLSRDMNWVLSRIPENMLHNISSYNNGSLFDQ